jgi:UPF0755 protein
VNRKQSSGWRWLFIVLLLGVAAAALGGVWIWGRWNRPYRGFTGDGIFVDIPKGTTSGGIARILAEAGVVQSTWEFQMLCRVRRQRLQAGEYRFETAKTPLEIHSILAQGKIYFRTVTIPEGWTTFDIADFLEQQGIAKREAVMNAASETEWIQEIAPRVQTLEGFLFPATYQFTRRATPQVIVQAMVARFQQVWPSLRRNGELEMTPAEIVTLASLVEKEARVPEERALIAGVYLNRLKRGMALQCDPTVIYALQLAGKWDGKIGYADLRFQSPYNTYLHRGLPPGPIANPGEASLRAALQPTETKYLYFVADNQGRHFFSETLEQHNRNVKKYLKLIGAERSDRNGVSKARRSAARGARKNSR